MTISWEPNFKSEKENPSKSVIQPWVSELPWKWQSILFSGLRGPDNDRLTTVKKMRQWLRSACQFNADPGKLSYMGNAVLPAMAPLYQDLEYCTVHYVHHFLDSLAIVAYGHPVKEIAESAARIYYKCAEELFHLRPEEARVFFLRHRDKRDGVDPSKDEWLKTTCEQEKHFVDGVLQRFQPERSPKVLPEQDCKEASPCIRTVSPNVPTQARELVTHNVNGVNGGLRVFISDKPGAGGACHRYDVIGFDTGHNPSATLPDGYKSSFSRMIVLFQNGPLGETVPNGVTHEVLLAIVADRLEHFQAGPYACHDNAVALSCTKLALTALKNRTEQRVKRGVEGTHVV